jgi:hypothetical protein
VELPPEARRAGLVTQASFLAMTGRDQGTSAIGRGKWVREALLCETLPAPPPNIPELPEPKPGQSERDRLAMHREDVSCAPCHRLLDPVGFGLEQYDAIGGLRMRDASGNALTGKGELVGFDVPAFEGGVGLARKLAESPRSTACTVERILEYAVGRSALPEDDCLEAQLAARFEASGHDLRETLLWFVRSDAFRTRNR